MVPATPRPPPDAAPRWHLYVLRRADGALYTGITTDVERRVSEHARGTARGARSLRARGPLTLVYRTPVGDRSIALRAEHRFKALSKHAKEALVRSTPGTRALLDTLGLDAHA